MEFHALPRRHLQALCKRNGIRANTTNVAMADALAALPAVDGIEEYATPPAAEPTPVAKAFAAEEEKEVGEGEMRGISPHEVIILDGSEDEEKDLMPDQDEEKAPALGVGRRRASRRARVEPVPGPATRKRAAASMAEAAAEAVPARTTRARSQRTVVSAPEEEAPKARRTSRRAVARKTSTEQEEEEKGTQGDASDGCVVDSSVEAWQPDVQRCEHSPILRDGTVSSEDIHHASEDTEMVPANEVPLATLKSGEAAKEVDFTSGVNEENEIPASGEMLQSAAKAVEEKEDIAADEMTNKTDMSVEEKDKDLMPALGVGRRRASRRARVEPVTAPATRKRASESMAETAAEVVPARTTRARSQRTVLSAPEEEAPKARRTSRRAVTRKSSTEQEEEEKGTQGHVSDGCVVHSVKERHADVQQCEDSPIFQNDTVSSEKIHHSNEDTQMVPVNEVPLATLKSGDAAEEVDFTSGVNEENEIPTSGEMLQSAAKAVEEKEDIAADEMTNNTDMSVEEKDKDLMPALGVGRRRASRRTWVEPVTAPATRKRASESMAETAAEVVPARTTRAQSQRTVLSASEEEAPKARRTSRRAVTRKSSTEQEEEEKGTQGHVSDGCVVHSVKERHADVQQCEDSPIFQNDTVSSEKIHHSSEDTQMVPVNEVPLATLKSGDAAEEVNFTSQVPTSGEMIQSAAKAMEEKEDMAAVEEEAALAMDEMSQRSATVEEGVIEVVTVDNLSQATVTDDEGVFKESGFTVDLTDLFVEEEAAVVSNEVPVSLATMDESVKEEVVPVDYLSQATVTDDEGAVKESAFSCDLPGVSFEEKGVVAADGVPQSLATLDESVEQVVTVENMSQATLTDDEGAVKGSGFSCDLADVSVEEDGVVAADEMSQRSATLDESVKEEGATIENLSQATVTDDEWLAKESTFAGDLLPVVDTSRDFSDHIVSPLSAGKIATKSISVDSITVQPLVSEFDDVPVLSNGGGHKNVTEPVAVEREKEGKECEALGSLSLRKLRIKLKEKVAVEREKEGKECEALGSLSRRKFRIKLNEKVAVAQENEADDVPLCMYSSIGGVKNASEPVAVEREEEMKEGNESEALGSLSLRKLRIKLKENVAVAQENQVKEGNGSMALDKLSLRKLKMKLKETLNAQNVIAKSHPSTY